MPQRFGRYVLLDRMGVGGMAEVYRAVVPGAEGWKRDLVVKKILTAQAQTPNFIDMFVHEARISALLHHPNVVQVFDFGQVDGNYFLAMELLRGRDLLGVLRGLRERKRLMPIAIATHIAHQVALGLGYAHALTAPTGEPLHIIHRDVSPSNIMCLQAGGVKLLDFGIAQAIGEIEASETDAGAGFKGKLGYMAPERLQNKPQDHRVDLFALGIVTWEMLTGRRLFHGKSDAEKMTLLLEKAIPVPSSVRPEIPPALDAIVAKALERDPDRRYSSGQTMADELEAVLADLKYQSRMLPTLLTELFGSSPSAAHVAMSLLPPEFLAVDPTPSVPPTPRTTPTTTAGAALPSSPSVEEQRTPGTDGAAAARGSVDPEATTAATPVGRWHKTLVAGLVVAVAAALGGGMVVHSARPPRAVTAARIAPAGAARAAPLPEPPAKAATTTTAMATAGADTVSGTAATAVSELAVAPVAPSPVRPPAVHRPPTSRSTARVSTGRIARGLSIDPFAEAAARGAKE